MTTTAVLDEAIKEFSQRHLITSVEVVDKLLEIRLVMASDEEDPCEPTQTRSDTG